MSFESQDEEIEYYRNALQVILDYNGLKVITGIILSYKSRELCNLWQFMSNWITEEDEEHFLGKIIKFLDGYSIKDGIDLTDFTYFVATELAIRNDCLLNILFQT